MTPQSHSIKYFAYVRKSTEGEEKQALSIESQKEKIREFFPNVEIVEVIEERHSAFLPNSRPRFAEMIERIRKSEAQGIVAWHPDRLSRNEIDAATLTYMLRTRQILDLKFGSYHFDNSPEGIMMLQLALSQSQYSSAKLSKDVKRGMEQKARMGWMPGVAPAGYLNSPEREKGCKVVVKDPVRFPLVRKMWGLMLTGTYTPPEIVRIANKEWGYRTLRHKRMGDNPMSRSGIYKIFTGPFYYGWFEYPVGSGNWHQGKHEPMVTQEEFERVQTLLGRRRGSVPQTREFAFTGLIRCGECGCQITAEEKHQLICTGCKFKFSCLNRSFCPRCQTPIERMKNPTLLRYVYYRCTKKKPDVRCAQGYVEVRELERQIDDYLASIQINQRYLDWALKYLKKSHERESASQAAILKSKQDAIRSISKKLNRLLEMRLAEEIGEEEYRTKKREYEMENARLQESLGDLDHRQAQWLTFSEQTFQFARNARFRFVEGTIREKREILATLGSNLTLKDKKLSIDAPEPFFIIKKGLAAVPNAREGLEPEKRRVNTEQKAALTTANPRWLSIVCDVRTYFFNSTSSFSSWNVTAVK